MTVPVLESRPPELTDTDRRCLRLPTLAESRYSVAVGAYFLVVLSTLWTPILLQQGYVFTRDPSFFAATRADVGWSLGTFSFLGGVSNISSQGLFYAPYSAITFVLRTAGLGAADIGKITPVVLSALALFGAFSLLGDLGYSTIARLLGATFFLLNPWSLDQFGYFYLWTGYCMLPWVIVGTRRIIFGGRAPLWYPAIFALLGGIESWTVAFIVITVTVLSGLFSSSLGFYRQYVRPYLWFLGVASYWLLPYSASLLLDGTSLLRYPGTGGVLESRLPLVNLLELRDFWWPHLSPTTAAGHAAAAAATLASIVVVGTSIFHITENMALAHRHRSTEVPKRALADAYLLAMLAIGGLVLGEGTSGLIGPFYRWIHYVNVPGHTIIASLTRQPANLAGPFILVVAVGLASATHSRRPWPVARPGKVPRSLRTRRNVRIGCVAAATLACCSPSIVAFWKAYQPINVPQSYRDLDRVLPSGTVLELGYWDDQSLQQSSFGLLWRFSWSRRMAADPSLLASSINRPSLSPLSNTVNAFDRRAFTQPSGTDAARVVLAAARHLDVHSLVVENDLRRPAGPAELVQAMIQGLDRSGATERVVGQEVVFTIPGPSAPVIRSSTCRISRTWIWAGVLPIACPAGHGQDLPPPKLESPFQLPPAVGVGLSIRDTAPLWDGLGEVVTLSPRARGWLVAPSQLASALGGVVCVCAVTVLPVLLAVYRRRRSRCDVSAAPEKLGRALSPTTTSKAPSGSRGDVDSQGRQQSVFIDRRRGGS